MLAKELQELLRRRRMTAVFLWGAFLNSTVLLGVVAYIVVSNKPTPPDEMSETVIDLLTAGAVAVAATSLWLLSYRKSDNFIRRCAKAPPLPEHLAAGEKSGIPDPVLLEKIRSLGPRERFLLGLQQRWLTMLLINLALSDAVAMLGFMTAVLTGDLLKGAYLGTAGLLLTAFMFPNDRRLIERAADMPLDIS